MRRFRRVHTTTSLSGCLGGVGEERKLLSHAAQIPPSPPGSFLSPHPPPPGEGMDSPLSRATGNRVRLLRQGGAQGRRAKARCGWPGIKKKSGRQRHTEKHSKEPARDTQTQRHRERYTWSKRSPFTHTYSWSAYYKPSSVWRQSRAKESKTLQGLRTTR